MSRINSLLIIGMGTLILMIISFYNGYPLVYSDTGTYIYSGFDKFIPVDRPIMYGLFLEVFALNYSTWFVVIVQNFLTAFVLFELLKLFKFSRRVFIQLYLLLLLFLVTVTGIGWYSNQLMPDFLAPLTFLIIFILIKSSYILSPSKVFLFLILIFSLLAHFSHILIASVLMIILISGKLIFKAWFSDVSLKRIMIVAITVFSAWIILPGVNYMVEKKFILSKGSHVFLMAHLVETGILEKFLKENCSDPEFADCKLCQYKDSLPTELAPFIWSGDIFNNTGGWLESKAEYDKIIRETLVRPKYLALNIFNAINFGFIQLTKNDIGQGLSPYNEGSAPYGQIHWRFYDELNNYSDSRQNKWGGIYLDLDGLNAVHFVLILLSVFFVVAIFTSRVRSKIDTVGSIFLMFVLLSIVLNAFITAGLNAPCERFQARVVWLMPLALIILTVKNFDSIANTVLRRENNEAINH